MKLITNAHFYQKGSFDNDITALLVDNGRIVRHLYNGHKPNPDWKVMDLHGAYAYPGFIDAHTHSYSGGLYSTGTDLSACRSIDEVLALLFIAAQENKNYIFAWRFDETLITEKRFPTMKELDAVCPDSILLLRRVDGHSCILNTKARNMVPGLSSTSEVLIAEDNDLAVNWLQDNCPEEAILEAYHAASRIALRGGFTTLHTMIGDAQHNNQHYRLIRDHLGDFDIHFEMYPQSFNIPDALELGSRRIGGCILADGSIGSHTAALSTPYADRDTKGILYHDDQFWQNFVSEAHRNGLQVCVHCIGDAAIRQINSAYAAHNRDEVQELRHQLIHCEVTPDALVEEIASSGAVPVMQPAFDLLWGGGSGLYAQRLGNRHLEMNRYWSFASKGVRTCGSSDWYVTELDIAMSIHALINHHNPAERLSPAEAIGIYTENNAWLNHEEAILGKLEPGYRADLSVLDADLTKPFDYSQVHTTCVIREGNAVYELA
jgi:predicted amidohydrolase YtcJ